MKRWQRGRANAITGVGLMLASFLVHGYELNFDPVISGTAHQALFDVTMVGKTVYAVGTSGKLLVSKNGGAKWQAATTDLGPLTLLGVASSGSQVIAVGQMGRVWTRGSDASWAKADSGTEERLFAVDLNTQGLAATVGGFGTILISTDAGAHWQAVTPDWSTLTENGLQPHMYAVDVREDGVITVAGELGLILQSNDHGAIWTVAHQGSASIFSMAFDAQGQGYAVGQSGSVLRSDDGGGSWQALSTTSDMVLDGVAFDTAGNVVVTGMHTMLISRDGGSSWGRVADGDVVSAWYAAVAWTGITGNFLVVGHSGNIRRLTF